MDLLIHHRIAEASRLAELLDSLTRDPRVAKHTPHLQRHTTGLHYRFTGPDVPSGELRAAVAAGDQLGTIHIQLELSWTARLFSGTVESTLRTVAAEVLGADLVVRSRR